MPAYFVMVREQTTDLAALAAYGPKAAHAAEGHPMTPLAVYGDMIHLEGDKAEGVVILEFPSIEAAQAWYHSAAYQDAVKFRHAGSQSQAFLVQGV